MKSASTLLKVETQDVPTLEIEKPEIEVPTINTAESCSSGIATQTGVMTALALVALKLKKDKKDDE